MANENPLVKAISLNTPIAPEYQQQLLSAQRQQELAKLLMQRGLNPGDPNQMVSGVVVKKGLGDGLLQLANAYLGKKTQDAADKTLSDAQTSYTNSVSQMFAPSQGSSGDSAALAQALMNGSGPTSDNAAAMAQALQGQQEQGFKRLPGDSTGQLSAMMYMNDPAKYAEKMADYAAPTSEIKNNQWMGISPEQARANTMATSEIKNNQWMGISPEQARANLMAKAVADGSMKVGGGETVINPATGQPLYVGPDFKNGVAGGFDAKGQPVMGQIRGAEVLPQMAGMQKEAEARAAAGYSPVTVPTPGSPTMTTARALADTVNPQVSTQATPNPMQIPPGVQGQRDQIRLALLQDELHKAQTTGNQAAVNDLMKEIQSTQARQPQQLQGVKLENQGQKEVMQDVNKARLSTLQKSADEQQDRLATIGQMKNLLDSADLLGDSVVDPAFMAAANLSPALATKNAVKTQNFQSLATKLAIPAGGLGAQVSNADAERYKKAAFDLEKSKTKEQRQSAIAILEDVANKAFNNTNAAIKSFEQTGRLPDYGSNATPAAAAKQPQAPKALNSLPNPAQFVGKQARDAITGQLLRSDGKNWIKVQ